MSKQCWYQYRCCAIERIGHDTEISDNRKRQESTKPFLEGAQLESGLFCNNHKKDLSLTWLIFKIINVL